MRSKPLAELDPKTLAALRRDGTVDLTTVGARTGTPRRIEIWFLHLEDRTFITGISGLRGWYANVLVNQAVVFHLKESVRADLPARANPVLDPELREWVFTRPHRWNRWYLASEPLDSLVATAPMVEITFD
jgi:hypothetical protein